MSNFTREEQEQCIKFVQKIDAIRRKYHVAQNEIVDLLGVDRSLPSRCASGRRRAPYKWEERLDEVIEELKRRGAHKDVQKVPVIWGAQDVGGVKLLLVSVGARVRVLAPGARNYQEYLELLDASAIATAAPAQSKELEPCL